MSKHAPSVSIRALNLYSAGYLSCVCGCVRWQYSAKLSLSFSGMSCGCGTFRKVTSAISLRTNPPLATYITRWGNLAGSHTKDTERGPYEILFTKNIFLIYNFPEPVLLSYKICHLLPVTFSSNHADIPPNRLLTTKYLTDRNVVARKWDCSIAVSKEQCCYKTLGLFHWYLMYFLIFGHETGQEKSVLKPQNCSHLCSYNDESHRHRKA